ncbi:MAG: hypothetical protein ACXVPU_08705 [Bacteroidia bacterium]
MDRKTDGFVILNKSLGANGPSMGLGVPTMIIGIVAILAGFAQVEITGIIIGFLLLLLAAYLILSIDCIAIDKFKNQLYLYKDYYFVTKGKQFLINEYESVCIYYQIDKPTDSRRSWNTIQLKTFTVTLITKDGQKLILKESGDIDIAKKLQYLIASETGLKLNKDPIRE